MLVDRSLKPAVRVKQVPATACPFLSHPSLTCHSSFSSACFPDHLVPETHLGQNAESEDYFRGRDEDDAHESGKAVCNCWITRPGKPSTHPKPRLYPPWQLPSSRSYPTRSPPLTAQFSDLSLAAGEDRWASIGYARILGLFHHTPSYCFQN